MTASIPIRLSDALTPDEVQVVVAEAARRRISLDQIGLEAVRQWIASRPANAGDNQTGQQAA